MILRFLPPQVVDLVLTSGPIQMRIHGKRHASSRMDFCPYQVLGVSSAASKLDIKKAYFQLAFQLHPDRNVKQGSGRSNELQKSQFIRVTKAYEILGSDSKRRIYDWDIRNGHTLRSDGVSERPYRQAYSSPYNAAYYESQSPYGQQSGPDADYAYSFHSHFRNNNSGNNNGPRFMSNSRMAVLLIGLTVIGTLATSLHINRIRQSYSRALDSQSARLQTLHDETLSSALANGKKVQMQRLQERIEARLLRGTSNGSAIESATRDMGKDLNEYLSGDDGQDEDDGIFTEHAQWAAAMEGQ